MHVLLEHTSNNARLECGLSWGECGGGGVISVQVRGLFDVLANGIS